MQPGWTRRVRIRPYRWRFQSSARTRDSISQRGRKVRRQSRLFGHLTKVVFLNRSDGKHVVRLDTAADKLHPDLCVLLDDLVLGPIGNGRRVWIKLHVGVDELSLSAFVARGLCDVTRRVRGEEVGSGNNRSITTRSSRHTQHSRRSVVPMLFCHHRCLSPWEQTWKEG